MKPKSGETLDSIKDVKILQSEKGYRFSIDAVILEDFISAKKHDHGIELGAGSGVISILLAKRFSSIKLTGVEIQKTLAVRAEKNVKLNSLEDRVTILRSDINKLKNIFPANKADLVFSNPPFRKTETGLISNDEERAAARHEIKMTLSGLIETASYLLKDRGRLYMIYHPFRLIELISQMQRSNIEPKRMKFVHSRQGEEAKMVLIEAVKGSGKWLKVLPPLYIHNGGNEYTGEIKKMLGK
ncbi:MAG: tRNA1(Val) (adenine(37)-N6)-methyltransferase [Nitrospirae bacterium]|nr:tRNA1(Val) (adenine(37)-N6)-methyltransferase [Nitrospirota bacterium]